MSGLNVVAVQDIIAAHIREEFSGYQVYEDDVLDDESLLRASNKTKPYIVLRWSGLMRNGRGASFGGVRLDEYVSSVDINVVAPTPTQCRKAINVIMDKLIGWKPTGGGALTPEGGAALFVVNNREDKPHLYIASGRLTFAVNSEDPGAYITP